MKVVMVGGGTGGHINPAISIANHIRETEPETQICFVGTEYGLEGEIVPKSGFDIRFIRAKGISRDFSIDTLKAVWENVIGLVDSFKLLRELKPDVVIGTGGYVCASFMFVAKNLLRIPVYIHESNAVAGMTNKIISKFANGVAIGFEESRKDFTNKNVVLTGNPVKSEFEYFKKEPHEGYNVLVFGGSQGARTINNAVLDLISQGNIYYNLTYVTGPKLYEEVIDEINSRGIHVPDNVYVTPYIYDMEEIYKTVDLVISRSGALTVSELAATKTPAILIPLATAAENHQYLNALQLVHVGAANIIKEVDLNSSTLRVNIDSMLSNRALLEDMGECAARLHVNNAAAQVYNMAKGR